jgi:hypothetical protein
VGNKKATGKVAGRGLVVYGYLFRQINLASRSNKPIKPDNGVFK